MLLAVGLVLAALLCHGLSQAAAQDLKFFRIGTGTTGGTYFPIGGLIANAISNPPGSRPCGRGGSCGVPGLIAVAQATSGAVENIANMRSGALEAALAQADVAYWAYTGALQNQQSYGALRAIANLYTEAVHLVVRADSDIQGVIDLKGKAVSLGEEGSGTLVDARLILDAYGIRENELQVRYLKPGPAADRLAEGVLDAFFIIGGYPVAAVADLAARVPIRLIPFNDPVAERLRANLPYFTDTLVPAGTYQNLPATQSLGMGAMFVVRGDLPDDLIHGITAALWHETTLRLLAEGHPKGKSIALATALQGLSVPLHPGAERYYREVGLLHADGAPKPPPGERSGMAGQATPRP